MKYAQYITKHICYIAMVMIMAVSFVACNPHKKNTAASRKYTAFITKYNIYYNGDKHYKETLQNMEDKYEDDYSRTLFMHPVEAKNDKKAPQPSGDFKRSIEKAQKAIQIRSIKKKPEKKANKASDPKYKEWMKRDEYNPVLHNSWMMMGRSQYLNGDFLGAASTFFYVSKHFTWLPATVTDAKLWQARCYLALDWLYEAELIIKRIKPAELTDKELEYQYNFTYADFYIRSKEFGKAVPYLKTAIKYSKGSQKNRLLFLLGQAYIQIDDKTNAYEAFKKVGGSSSAPYRTKLNARIKQSEVYTGTNIEPEVKSLKRMTRYERNKDYLDQIYYAIGNLFLTRGDTIQAMDQYILATEKSTRNGIDKAIAQITLGGLYYEQGNYEKAQPCYSEAIPQLPETYKNYKQLKLRSDVLDELAVYSQNVNLQDSLLHLSTLSEEELYKVIDKIIDDLKKKEKEEAEEARRQEFMAQQGTNNTLQDANQREFNINTDKSWYFYNATTRNAGKTEFQKRWGARKLEDDWRRRNKASFNTADFDSDKEKDGQENDEEQETTDNNTETDSIQDAEKIKAAEAANDPHNREYYLKQIPRTDEEKATSHDVIQEGLYNMGVILKDKLDDNKAALIQFDRLLNDYPDNVYRLDVYYNLYLMYMRAGDTAAAEKWRQLILKDFADSKYGVALNDPDYIKHLKEMEPKVNALYEATYDNYMANQNDSVHAAFQTMLSEYPLSNLMPRFMFLDALAYVTEKNNDKFNEVLREMLEKYPDTQLAPIVSSWLKGMSQGRQLQTSPDGKNMRGRLWDIQLSNDSITAKNDSIAAFEIDENAPQLLVLVFPTDEVNANALLYEVARHNFNSFVVKDFDVELMNFGRLGMLVIKGFDNQRQLNHYRTVMAQSSDFKLPSGVEPVAISVKNFDVLLNQGRTFDDYFRFLEEKNYIDPQAKLLQPEQIETLSEAEENAKAIEEETDTAEPQHTPDATDADASKEIPATDTGTSKEIPATDTDASKDNPAASDTSTSKDKPAASDTGTSKDKPTATDADTSKDSGKDTNKETTKDNNGKKNNEKGTKTETKPESKDKKDKTKQPTGKKKLPDVPTGSEGDDDPLLI